MAKTLKRIYAGCLQVAALTNRVKRSDGPQQRAAKQKASSEAQRKLNQTLSWQKLELMLAVNFPTPGSALVATLTFDDGHMPATRAEAQLRFKYFLKLLRQDRKAAGLPEPVVFWAPEVLTSESGRWHFHLVLDNTGQDYEMIRRCWIYGSDVDVVKLRVDGEKNHETQARYMTKELRDCQEYGAKPGLHGWSYTRNAKRPETDTVIVPDDYELAAPEGSTVLIDERKSTEFSSWQVMKVRWGGDVFPKPPRAKRRRRRRG